MTQRNRNLNAQPDDPGHITIDDPETGGRVRVGFRVRGDVVAQLFGRGAIDETQRQAGNELARLFERSATVGYGAVDLSRLRVDSSGTIHDQACEAMQVASRLVEVQVIVGQRAYQVLRLAIAEGLPFQTIASQTMGGRNRRNALPIMIGLALEDLAIWWGHDGGPTAQRRLQEMKRNLRASQVAYAATPAAADSTADT